MKVKSLSRVRLLATPWTAAYQAPPSMGFSRQEYWSGVPLPSPKLGLTHVLFYSSILGIILNRGFPHIIEFIKVIMLVTRMFKFNDHLILVILPFCIYDCKF